MQNQTMPEKRPGVDAEQAPRQQDGGMAAPLSSGALSMAQAFARLLQLVDGAPQTNGPRERGNVSLQALAASPPMPGTTPF
jgi:hypothetical protein